MSAQPQRQQRQAAKTHDRPTVRIVKRSECAEMVMPKPAAPAEPRYDFVGIAG